MFGKVRLGQSNLLKYRGKLDSFEVAHLVNIFSYALIEVQMQRLVSTFVSKMTYLVSAAEDIY